MPWCRRSRLTRPALRSIVHYRIVTRQETLVATKTFTTEVCIACTPERVGSFLSDFPNYAKIHPLITAIRSSEPRPGAPDAPAPRKWYKVTDRLRLGPIPFSITYDVAMASSGPQSLLFEVWQWPGVYLRNRTSWQAAAAGGTYLHEEVVVHAPLLLLFTVVRTAQAAHRRSFAVLKAKLESEVIP